MSGFRDLAGSNGQGGNCSSRLRRLLQLVRFLEIGESRNTRDLAELLGVSRRTVFRDLKTLREADYPVYFDEKTERYFVVDDGEHGTTLSKFTSLSPRDATMLATTVALVERHPQLRKSAKLIINTILACCDRTTRQTLSECVEAVAAESEDWCALESVVDGITTLCVARLRRTKVRLAVKTIEGDVKRTLFSPYHVSYINSSWVTVGRSSVDRERISIDLTDILDLEPTKDAYEIPPRLRPHIRFDQPVNRREPEAIELRLYKSDWLKRPFTPEDDVTIRGPDQAGKIRVSFAAVLSEKLVDWLWQCGERIVIIQPSSLRKLLEDRARKLLEQLSHVMGH